MKVVKRSGALEPVSFDKITERLQRLCWDLDIDVCRVAARVCASVVDGISTRRLDELTADVAASLVTDEYGYGVLAARVLVSNLQKNTSPDILETWEALSDVLSDEFLGVARKHAEDLQAMVDYERDYLLDYFGFRTAEKMYLLSAGGRVLERPQHLFLRTAVAIWGDQLDRVRETYDCLSLKKFTHASPTLFNAGTKFANLSSCFLTGVEDDSIDGIFDAYAKCARISKHGGGIGLHVSGVRSKGSRIRGTNGTSDGLVPMLRVANAITQYVNQGESSMC